MLLHDTRFTAVALRTMALLFRATSPYRYYHTAGTTRHNTCLCFYVPDQSVQHVW